jgi:hypothetical protein
MELISKHVFVARRQGFDPARQEVIAALEQGDQRNVIIIAMNSIYGIRNSENAPFTVSGATSSGNKFVPAKN